MSHHTHTSEDHHAHLHTPAASHSHQPGGLKESNRQYFDAQAHTHSHGYDANPAAQQLAKKCGEAILEQFPFDEEKTVIMDYACGGGLVSQALAPHTKTIIGVDISPKSVSYYNDRVANQGIPPEEMKAICVELVERGAGEADVFDGVQFDVIVCTNAYHHFEDINSITTILSSYLKPGTGTLLVIDLIRTSDSEPLHEAHSHIVAHKGGFKEESIQSAFIEAAKLQGFSFKVAFQMRQHGRDVDLFIAKGVRAST
ncbi:Methyltransferase domain containing protein [Ceratobasidium theobromae]|uniref:Methyltransferase domain containing protein n=1 Tax=Ceratobasidium theobromae TaxID=1582974 RepID=A0A5N5QUG9_9AGAM|nr:Methyltransferase domain containing protein [Ceratobasidium theobromae]